MSTPEDLDVYFFPFSSHIGYIKPIKNGIAQKLMRSDWPWLSLAWVDVWIVSIRSEGIMKPVIVIVLARSQRSKTNVLVKFEFPWILKQNSTKTGLDFSTPLWKLTCKKDALCSRDNTPKVKIWVQQKWLLETDKISSYGIWNTIAL